MRMGNGTRLFAVTLVIALSILGCGQEYTPVELADSRSARSAEQSLSQGALVAETSVPLADRPVDLASFPEGEVSRHVRGGLETTLGNGFELPWIKTCPEPDRTPYWSAQPPLSLTLDLERACYVSYVVIQPFLTRSGLGDFEVKILSEKNEEFDTDPPCEVSVKRTTASDEDRPADAFQVGFSPRYAQKLRFYFNRGSGSARDDIYVRKIRVLGRPADGPAFAERVPLSDSLQERLDQGATNVAAFSFESVIRHVFVSEDLYENGRFDQPWLDGQPVDEAQRLIPPYWCAPEPAWAEVDLGRDCYVNAITVQPYSEGYGLTAFYAKIVDEEGNELDTTPPCECHAPPIAPSDKDLKPPPLTATFEPVLARKLKLYFPRGGSENKRVYVEKVEIRGIEAGASSS